MALTTTPSELTATALTLTTAAQPNITSVGTLTALTGGTGDLIWDTNTLVVDSSTDRVGIGTASPSFDFEINRSSAAAAALISSGNNDAMLRLYTANNVGKWRVIATTSDDNLSIQNLNSGASAFNNRMTFTDGGLVGIGTASPAYETQIYSADDTVLSVVSGDSSSASLYLGDAVATRGRLTYNNNGDYLAIYTDNNERIRIDSTGKVGIGRTPANILDIEFADGSNVTAGNIGDNSVTGINIINTTNSNGSGTMLKMMSNNGNNMTAIAHEQVATNSSQLLFYTEQAGTFSEKMRINEAGTVRFTEGSYSSEIHHHSWGATLETTTSDGSDNYGVGLDAGSGTGSNARGAGIWCYGNEHGDHPGSIVTQVGSAGHYKLTGGSSVQSFIRIDQYGSVGFEKANGRVIVGAGYNTTGLYGATSASGIGFFGHDAYSSCGAHIETSTNGDTGWAAFYMNKFNWGSGDDARWLSFGVNGYGTDYGTINYDGTNFAIVNASDYRLKENIVDYSGGLAKLEELKVRTYNKKEGVSKYITQQGFIAHEAATANIPGFISGEKDAMKTNEAGETVPDYQTVNKEALIPYLVSAIQELSAKVKELESK